MKKYLLIFATVAIFFVGFIEVKPTAIIPIKADVALTPTPGLVTEDQSMQIVDRLPEVTKERIFLTSKGSVSVTYVEGRPTDTDPNYHVYFGEKQVDHYNRLTSFLVNSKTGEVTIDDIVSGSVISYDQWKTNCGMEGCQIQ